MHVFGRTPETLPVSVRRDASTGLPLLTEGETILEYLMAYLALPYSVVEHGCGKKASLIIKRLLDLGIPAYGIWRGLALERDMSPQAMRTVAYEARPHAMVADNHLTELGALDDPELATVLEQTCPGVVIEGDRIHAGPFLLHHEPKVQFVLARSHVYPIVWFWDPEHGRPARRVIDPSLDRTGLFAVPQIRSLLRAPEALLFSSPLLGHFRLDDADLTADQRGAVAGLLGAGEGLMEVSVARHDALLRELTGAEPGTLGDPASWTYANNMRSGDDAHFEELRRHTGRGDAHRHMLAELLQARTSYQSDVHGLRQAMRDVTEDAGVERVAERDARWSMAQLEPLADVAMSMMYFASLGKVAKRCDADGDLLACLHSTEALEACRGVGVRLRRRIDVLARASEDPQGEIDARALNDPFVQVTLETIRQMNDAGLAVCIDAVGNVHGLQLDAECRESLRRHELSVADLLRHAIVFGSHIDSVKDAGKFDGRLGVAGGIEVAHVLYDLQRFHGHARLGRGRSSVRLVVSAFVGEEMTFTGRGVSMPGSAAVAGRAKATDVHEMENGDGERYLDRLLVLLRALRDAQAREEISLINELAAADPQALLDACFEPTEFYSRHSFERHIEQAPVLDRHGIPMALAETIMGIHQEDFFFEGALSESAALELARRMRLLTQEPKFADARITIGILEALGEMTVHEHPAVAFRWTLEGEKNHAGATQTPDRRDPLIAAARLSWALQQWLDGQPGLRERGLRALASNVRIDPGKNRNVIPGKASVTLALLGGELSPEEAEAVDHGLQGFAIGVLAKSVPIGGEGMRLCRTEPISYALAGSTARMAIDLRAAEEHVIRRFRARIDGIVDELRDQYDVDVRGEVAQQVQPFGLSETGQVLLMERSYGGSHNPNETEMLIDITRGTVLQLAVAHELLAMEELPDGFNLMSFTGARVPEPWSKELPRYTSAALHDTCNIAAAAR